MKLDYVFNQYDYVVCTGLEKDQIQSLVARMAECGANVYEVAGSYNSEFNTLAWNVNGDTYFQEEYYYSENEDYTEVKWEDIVKETKPSTTIGSLIQQIQFNITPSSPEVIITSDGRVVIYALEQEWDVSGKSADKIDQIYQALDLLMGV